MLQDAILLSYSTRELARSPETDGEVTPRLGSSLLFRQTPGAGKQQAEQVLKMPARLDSVQQVPGLKCHKSRSPSTRVGVRHLPAGAVETQIPSPWGKGLQCRAAGMGAGMRPDPATLGSPRTKCHPHH